MRALLQQSEHVVAMSAERLCDVNITDVECARCCQRPVRAGLCSWLASPCVPLMAQPCSAMPGLRRIRLTGKQAPEAAPARTINGDDLKVMVGSKGLHSSHKLLNYAGYWWCCRCGAWTRTVGQKTVPRLLTVPCGHPTRGGRQVLARLAKGLPPKPELHWSGRVPAEALIKSQLQAVTRDALRCQHAEAIVEAASHSQGYDEEMEEDNPLGHPLTLGG